MFERFFALVCLLHLSWTQRIDPSCDFMQEMVLGQEYFIYNKEFPSNYRQNSACRWIAKSPANTVIVMSCNEMNIPVSQNCTNEQLKISLNGDENFHNSINFCGKNTFTMFSERNKLTLGLFAGAQSVGGTFVCSLSAMRLAPRWCSCGMSSQTKIVGGRETKPNEFPWMAVLFDIFRNDTQCGATIISEKYAVTAAHCFNNQTPKNLKLLVGDHDLSKGTETPFATYYPIRRFVLHPGYAALDYKNDIAVVETTTPMHFNEGVSSVCLPFRYGVRNFENNFVKVLGWGFTDVSGYKSNTLQEVDLKVITNLECSQALRRNIPSTQMCTYMLGRDSCTGDSGGPLLWRDANAGRYELAGLVSNGVACATRLPAVNTRITSFLSWITSVTSDAEYCIR